MKTCVCCGNEIKNNRRAGRRKTKYCSAVCRNKHNKAFCIDLKKQRLEEDKARTRANLNIAHIKPYDVDKLVLLKDFNIYTQLTKRVVQADIVKPIKVYNGRGNITYNTVMINDFILFVNGLIDNYVETLNISTKSMIQRLVGRLDYVYNYSVIPADKERTKRTIPSWAVSQSVVRDEFKITEKRLAKLVSYGYLKKLGSHITKASLESFRENHLEILNLRSNYWKMQ